MKSNSFVLLRTLLMSTSQINILKHSKDKKKKGIIIGNFVGMSILYLFLMAYCIATCIGYSSLGMQDSIPVMCAIIISSIAFIFTIIKTNGYLFNFKEYDMLMSLPFKAKTVAAAKFLYMYIKTLAWFMSISLAMLIGYAMSAKPSIIVYPLWIILTLLLPIIPMLIAAFIGFIIARISAGFKKTNIIQTVLLFIFVLVCFFSRFIIEGIAKNSDMKVILESVSDVTANIGAYYLPAGWFSSAIVELDVAAILLLIGVTIVLFEIVFIPVGRSYRKINSLLKSHAASKAYKMTKQKKMSVANAIAFKEFKRFLGSSTYMVNAGFGIVIVVILGIVALFIGIDALIATVLQGAPITKEMLYPAIPLIIYFFIGMVPTTTCTPSLEGKNYWIVQSLPLEKKVLYQGKMLFNLYLTIPVTAFATICFCISAKAPILNSVLYVVEGVLLCAFSTIWGCVSGISHIRLDWENEVEVIKQGAAVAIYLFPNMLITMGLIVLVVFLGMKMDSNIVSLIIMAIVAAFTSLGYMSVLGLAKKK